MIAAFLVFVIALAALIKSSDYFTCYAEKLGLKLHISPFIIGVTIVAIGTSLPELVSSIIAVLKNTSEIVIANVVGSNIANVLLIIGVTGLVAKHQIAKRNLFAVDLPFLWLVTAYITVISLGGVITAFEGAIGLILLGIFIWFALREHRIEQHEYTPKEAYWQLILYILISGVVLYYSAQFTIDSIIAIAQYLNVGPELIALTAVAFGTSLPELAVVIQAARKKQIGMIFGNIIGSNIFNGFAVLGISSLIGELFIPASILIVSVPVMIITALIFTYVVYDKKVSTVEGSILLVLYLLYISATVFFM